MTTVPLEARVSLVTNVLDGMDESLGTNTVLEANISLSTTVSLASISVAVIISLGLVLMTCEDT